MQGPIFMVVMRRASLGRLYKTPCPIRHPGARHPGHRKVLCRGSKAGIWLIQRMERNRYFLTQLCWGKQFLSWGSNRWIPEACWPVILAGSVSSRPMKDWLKKQDGQCVRKDVRGCLLPSTCACTHTHTYATTTLTINNRKIGTANKITVMAD